MNDKKPTSADLVIIGGLMVFLLAIGFIYPQALLPPKVNPPPQSQILWMCYASSGKAVNATNCLIECVRNCYITSIVEIPPCYRDITNETSITVCVAR